MRIQGPVDGVVIKRALLTREEGKSWTCVGMDGCEEG